MNNQWISVEDRLPELGIWVLTFDGASGIWIGYCFDGVWIIQGAISTVTHWMPLPEPPEVQS